MEDKRCKSVGSLENSKMNPTECWNLELKTKMLKQRRMLSPKRFVQVLKEKGEKEPVVMWTVVFCQHGSVAQPDCFLPTKLLMSSKDSPLEAMMSVVSSRKCIS